LIGHTALCHYIELLHVVYAVDIGAFKQADRIPHSPPAARVTDVPVMSSSSLPLADELTEFSREVSTSAAGPLSSTLLDVSDHSAPDVDTLDTVAMKLFTQMQLDG